MNGTICTIRVIRVHERSRLYYSHYYHFHLVQHLLAHVEHEFLELSLPPPSPLPLPVLAPFPVPFLAHFPVPAQVPLEFQVLCE